MLDRYRLQIGLSALVLIIITLGIIIGQDSYGKKHEATATVAGVQADTKLTIVGELKAKMKAQQDQIATLQASLAASKWKYDQAKAQIEVPLPPAPIEPHALTQDLATFGFAPGVVVSEVPSSHLGIKDAGLVYTWKQEADRVPFLKDTLLQADHIIEADGRVILAKDGYIATQGAALTAALDAERLRNTEATELGKALKVEKQKRWQKYVYGVAGAAVVFLVKK